VSDSSLKRARRNLAEDRAFDRRFAPIGGRKIFNENFFPIKASSSMVPGEKPSLTKNSLPDIISKELNVK